LIRINPERVELQSFDIHLAIACLREAPPCGAKAGILKFELA